MAQVVNILSQKGMQQEDNRRLPVPDLLLVSGLKSRSIPKYT